MRNIVIRYQYSKYGRFTSGLLFAMISGISLLLCFSGIHEYQNTGNEVLLPFFIAVVSMILGFVTMFGQNHVAKEKAGGLTLRHGR